MAGGLILLWIAALFAPVAVMDRPANWVVTGLFLLKIGWIGPLTLQFGWYANIIFFWNLDGVIFGYRTNRTRYTAAIALAALGANTFVWRHLFSDGPQATIIRHCVGYYIWLAAIFGSAVAVLASPLRGGPPIGRAAPDLFD